MKYLEYEKIHYWKINMKYLEYEKNYTTEKLINETKKNQIQHIFPTSFGKNCRKKFRN